MNGLAKALIDAVEAAVSNGPRLSYGTVTDDSPFMVRVGKSTVAVEAKHLAWYSPTIGDFVAVIVQGADRLVLGEIN